MTNLLVNYDFIIVVILRLKIQINYKNQLFAITLRTLVSFR